MNYRMAASTLAAFSAFVAAPASAAGPDFGYVYTAETEEAGETELSAWATDRRGKREGHYGAQDYRFEVERGIANRFQVSAYADLASHHVRGFNGELERVRRNFAFQGLEAEFIYQVADPSKGLGVAFYAEPGWSRISKVTGEKAGEFELELKAIVQKNFLANRLVWATNLTLEPEWEREHEEVAPGIIERHIEKELAFEVTTGLAYRLAPKWWLGVEGRYHSVYPNWTSELHRENYAVYAGPTVHYGAGEWSVTATWLPQLFGSPHASGSSLEFEDHERREFRLKISREF
jgi:hypothetical protein